MWAGFSWSANIETVPSGAQVFCQPIDAAEDEWKDLGTTPLESVRFAQGEGYRLRFELSGHRSVELLQTAIRQFERRGAELVKPVMLDPVDVLPEEMVRIPGFTHDLVDYADYFMDRFEVTNRAYQRFVIAGGYQTREYWPDTIVRDGKEVLWEEAVSTFVDRTGRSGPSTWSGSAYPAGQGEHPVSGVSWYEAGKDARGTIGGAWSDAPFHVGWIIPKSPWNRDSTNGFRLVRTFDDDDRLARLREPEEPLDRRDYSKEKPTSDAEFIIYRRLYAYDSLPLNAEVVAVDELEHWIRERVAFDLPYGERGGAFLYIPKNTDPPFETVVYWGGSGVLRYQSVDEEYFEAFDFLVRSGRVVAQPIFKGAYERDDATFSTTHGSLLDNSAGTKYRDYQIKWMQELSRTIDYLETREDIDSDRLGYYGFSWGGSTAPIVLAVEERIDAAVLNVGGLWDIYRFLPEIDPLNFVTRVRSPVLMLNGEYDIVFPLETAQKPMFELLGTDAAHKKHYVTSAGHIVPRDVLIRETLDWFDLYLGGQGN